MPDHGQDMIGSESESHVKSAMETNNDNTTGVEGTQVTHITSHHITSHHIISKMETNNDSTTKVKGIQVTHIASHHQYNKYKNQQYN